MDRQDRHTSKFYEASTLGSTSTRSGQESAMSAPREIIDLHDLRRSIAPPPGRSTKFPSRKNTEDYGDWRKRVTRTDEDDHKYQAHEYKSEYKATTTAKNISLFPDTIGKNFLHPPTPTWPPTPTYPNPEKPEDDNDETSLNPNRPSKIEPSSRFGWWVVCLLVLGVVMVTLAAVYATGSAKPLMKGKFFSTSSSNAILILRILTELCAVILAGLAVVVVEDLQWALASRPEGVSLLHFVGLDSGTGAWGLLRLLATAEWKQKYSSLFRLLVIFTIPIPGIILMGDITIELVYFPEKTYDVAAGIDDFNATLIYEMNSVARTALLVSMGSPAWSTRESVSVAPMGRGKGKCSAAANSDIWAPCEEAHLLTGGVVGISPQADDLRDYPDSGAYVVPKTKTVLVEYGRVHDIQDLYENGDCNLIGSSIAASYWCASTGSDNELLFGSSYCPLALQATGSCFENTNWTSPLQLATSIFIYKRYATINYSRSNFSILSVSDMTAPEQTIVKLEDYMLALSTMVPGFNASSPTKTTGDNSPLAIYAVTALPINDSEVALRMSLQVIRKAMAVPFNYFQKNFFHEGPSVWQLTEPRKGLSEDMYTTMSISIVSHQVVAGKISRWLFCLVSGMLLLLSAATIIATARICKKRPQRCGYPTLDFAAVCAVRGGLPPDQAPQTPGGGLHHSLTQLGQQPGMFKVARKIKHERVVVGG